MKKIQWKRVLAIAFILVLVAVFWVYRYNLREENFVASLRSRLQQATFAMQQQGLQVKALTDSKKLSFINIDSLQLTYPSLVFRNKKLIFWSDYRFMPGYDLLSGNYTFRLLSLRSGKYVIHRQKILQNDTEIEIFLLLPLYKKYEIDNQYLVSGLNTDLIPNRFAIRINGEVSSLDRNITAIDNTFLFSVFLDTAEPYHPVTLPIVFGFCLLLTASFWVNREIKNLNRKRLYEWASLFLLAYLALLRWFMIEFNLPYNLVESDLFDSKFYASSRLNPSLGDLCLNLMALFVWIFHGLQYFFRSKICYFLINQQDFTKTLLCIFLILLSFLPAYSPFWLIESLYNDARFQIPLDITQNLDFSGFRLIALFSLVLVFSIQFMWQHLIMLVVLQLLPKSVLRWFALGIGTFLLLLLPFIFENLSYNILVINILYLAVLFFFKLPTSLYRFRYLTSLYLFSGALVGAGIGAYSIFVMEQQKLTRAKQQSGLQLLAENDDEGEFLLQQAMQDIMADNFLQVKLGSLFPSLSLVELKIRQVHLRNVYFDKYNLSIQFFDNEGNPIKNSFPEENYATFVENYGRPAYKTDYENLYFSSKYVGESVIKQYVGFIKIDKNKENV
ncbi:MAG: hypothetical protein H7Y04_10950, partial [Verrucomicrobia bacterium]|nr:hypothetical protein [Cytophagales bacterium]